MILCMVSQIKEGEESKPQTENLEEHKHLKQELKTILEELKDVFGDKLHSDGVAYDDMPEIIPIATCTNPPNKPAYRYSPLEQAEIEKQVQAMLAQGLIEHSTSPYGAPVLLVKKPDGTWRFCVDYRALMQ